MSNGQGEEGKGGGERWTRGDCAGGEEEGGQPTNNYDPNTGEHPVLDFVVRGDIFVSVAGQV